MTCIMLDQFSVCACGVAGRAAAPQAEAATRGVLSGGLLLDFAISRWCNAVE